MDKNAIMYLNKLDRIVRELEDLETDYYKIQNELITAKLHLNLKEAEIMRNGQIDGKNEQIRNAQLLEHTEALQKIVAEKQKGLNVRKAKLYAKRKEYENLQYYVRLLETLHHQK